MAWGKKKQNKQTPDIPVEEQVVNLIEEVLFSKEGGIKADKVDSSDAISLRLAQILADQKDRLSRLFDNDYAKFESFMLSCVVAAKKGYLKFAENIKSSEIALHNALIDEANNVATKFDNHIKTFLVTLTKEKVNAINSEKTQADSTQTAAVKKIDDEQLLLNADLSVQNFVEEYLKSCDKDAAAATDIKKVGFIDPNASIYTAAQLTTYISAHSADFSKGVVDAFNALPDEETKNKFAEAVHAQVKTFDKEVNLEEGSHASKEQKYVDSFNEVEALRAKADTDKTAANQAKSDAEPEIIKYVDSIALTAGKTTEMTTEKSKGIIAAIDYAITLSPDNNEILIELAKMRTEYSRLLDAATLADKNLTILETKKKIEASKRKSFNTYAQLSVTLANVIAKGYGA